MYNVRDIADKRTKIHTSHSSTRPLSKDYDYIGVAGEVAFAKEFGLKVDVAVKPGGDKGIDFILPIGTVDVKCYRKPYNLLREVGKIHADILVLAGFDNASKEAYLIVWEYDNEMINCLTKDFGYGIVNHYKAAGKLKTIPELHKRCQ